MMPEEAIKDLDCLIEKLSEFPPETGTAELIGSLKMAIDVLEKQIPKKPVLKPFEPEWDFGDWSCPSCGEMLTDRIPFERKSFYFHCMNCGQKFDWEGVSNYGT